MVSVSKPRLRSALAKHRQQLRDRGLQRVEVQVFAPDAALLRDVAAALTDPVRGESTRALLLSRFAATPTPSLKDLLAAAPLDGIDLERVRDTGRIVDL